MIDERFKDYIIKKYFNLILILIVVGAVLSVSYNFSTVGYFGIGGLGYTVLSDQVGDAG